MENSNQYDELLIKYLAGDVNAEEKTFVEQWISSSEEHERYFEELKHVWSLVAVKKTLDQVLDGINMDDKWNRFQQNVATNETKVISINSREQLSNESTVGEGHKRKPVVYRLLVTAAIAASVLLVVGLGWKFLFQNKQETPVVQNTSKKADSSLFVVRHEVNTTGKEKRIQLADGSWIALENNSELTYREPFTDRRDITLLGKARFNVAKDKTRPFTVYSNSVSTTALGTEFTVTAYPNAKQITVRLYEGKVVVKPMQREDWRMKKDFYLAPGQEFVYSDQALAKVRTFYVNKSAPDESNKELNRDNPNIPKDDEGSWFMFNNQSLGQVLDQLGAMYNVKIIYNKNDVQNISWTGNYNRSDSLETILKRISILHNLTVIKKDSAFIINK